MVLLASVLATLIPAAAAHAAEFGLQCDTVGSDGARAYLSVRVTAGGVPDGPVVIAAHWSAGPGTPWIDEHTVCGVPVSEACAGEVAHLGSGGRAVVRQRCGSASAEFSFRDAFPFDGRLTCAVEGRVTSYDVWNCLGRRK